MTSCLLPTPDAPSQAKQGGRKVVAVLSSGEASVGGVAADAREPAKPLKPTDVMQPAYRPSKAAVNRCALFVNARRPGSRGSPAMRADRLSGIAWMRQKCRRWTIVALKCSLMGVCCKMGSRGSVMHALIC